MTVVSSTRSMFQVAKVALFNEHLINRAVSGQPALPAEGREDERA